METKNEKGIENKVMEQTSGTPDVTTETSGHVPKHKKQSCGEKITNKINGFLENGFANIGYTIASNPIKTIIISLVCLGLCLIGITEYTIENRGEKNWVSQSSDSLKHKDWVEYKFPAKYRQISIMLRNDNGNILTKDGLLDLLSVNERTLNAKTTYEAENGTTLPLTWNSICYSNIGVSGPCIPKSVLEIWRYNKTIIQNLTDQSILDAVNTENLRSPLTGQIMVFDNLIGGPAIKNTDGRIISASVLRINYRLKREEVFDEDKGELVDKAADAFEEEFDKIMANDPSGYTLYSFSEWAANEASKDVSEGDLQFFVIGYLLVIVYLALMLGSFSRINHKVYLAFSGIAVIGIAIGIAYGLGSGFQLKKNAVHDVLPFLLLGIGVDDIFIIVQNWDNVGGPDFSDSRTVPEKMSAAMRHAGVSILVTTVTDVCAFLVGASTILPALRSFCVWAAIGILAVFIYTISFFIALLTLDARRQKQRRDACCCCIKLKDDWKPMECSKKGYLNSFVKNIYGPAILSMPGKIIILLMTAGLLAGGSIGLHNLEQDFDFNWFLPTDSAPRQFTDNEKIFFPGNGQIANAYTGSIDYYNEYRAMELIETSLSSDPYVVSGSVNSWYKSYHIWLNETGRTAGNCSKNIYECRAINESMFYSHLNVFLETEIGKFYSRKIKIPSNGKIEASSIEYQHIIFDTAADEIEGMNSVQEDIKPGTIKTEPDSLLPFAYSPAYIGWETNDVITTELFRNIMLAGLCVLLVTLFLLSNILASIYVLLCVVFSLINLAGYMHFWDLTIDTVTTIIMVLAIGLTVDYSAHIGHGFMAARKGNRNERMQQALQEISPAVFHGGFSTLLAFILLSASDSYVFQTFFKVFFLTVAFGMFHGLFFLPVVLSLIGPKPYAVHHEDSLADNNIDSSERDDKISNGNGVQLEKMKTNGNTFVKGASDNPTYVVNN